MNVFQSVGARVPHLVAAALSIVLLAACAGTAATPSPNAASSKRPVGPPVATPLANPPAEPSGNGTTATIKTKLGDIVIELFTNSSPVAAENFANLAEAGYFDGIVFHRTIPEFVIQGGDKTGTGSGDAPFTIKDDKVVGDYERGIVAMARPANRDGSVIPDSQSSQFFICVADLKDRLPKAGRYAIFGRVSAGMDVVDKIVAAPVDGSGTDHPKDPVVMTSVTVKRP